MAFGTGSTGYGRDAGGGVSLSPRVILAVVIAVSGLVSYLSKSQVNPVTGQRQWVSMSVEEERALGLQAVPEMARKMGGILDPRRDARAREVVMVGQGLVERSDARRSPYADNFHFYLLDDPRTVNAFALPGGQIFLTRGLFERLASEDQLAAVLAHEIGHVVGRHSSEQMAKGQLGKTLATAVGLGASGGERSTLKTMMAAMAANQVLQLRYGRADESESDETGMKYMAQAGYDPHAMLELMQILAEASDGPRPPEFLSSHPLPETRMVRILDRDYARSGTRPVFPRPGVIPHPARRGPIYDL
jgi:predicted Zn-dependent protease